MAKVKKARKAKRSTSTVLPMMGRAMASIRKSTGKTATAAQLVPLLKGQDKEGNEVQLFANESDLGKSIASAVERMNDVDAVKNGTTFHKLAVNILAALKSTSPAAIFETESTADAKAKALAAELGIEIGEDGEIDSADVF